MLHVTLQKYCAMLNVIRAPRAKINNIQCILYIHSHLICIVCIFYNIIDQKFWALTLLIG